METTSSIGIRSHLKNGEILQAVKDDNIYDFIFGSNYVEEAGPSKEKTLELCRHFDKDDAPDDSSYSKEDREVTQHLKAFRFFCREFDEQGSVMTEASILQAHSILYRGLGYDGIEGVYRNERVAARDSKGKVNEFIRPEAISSYMHDFVADLAREIACLKDERDDTFDPFEFAARYKHRFVNIHPFVDGNGRMCRIIMNTLLLRFARTISIFGQTSEECDEYLSIASRGARRFHSEDGEIPETEWTGHLELANFVRKNQVQ